MCILILMLFQPPRIGLEESAVIDEVERIRDRLKIYIHTPRVWMGLLRRAALAKNVRASNAIEGYNVSVDDALAAAEDEEPLEATKVDWSAVWQYRQAMTYVIQLMNDPTFRYSPELIKSLHYMIMSYALDKDPGRYRPGSVFVYSTQDDEVVYEGPDAELVPGLVEELVESLSKPRDVHPMIAGALAHLNLAMIHPFRDGNGRMARCLQTLVLGRAGNTDPVFSSIEEYLGKNTDAYYGVLSATGQGAWNPQNNTIEWVRFCLTAHYRQAATSLNRIKQIEYMWDRLERIVTRTKVLPERTILALADAAMGLRVRNGTYRKAAEVSQQVASRDLKALVDAGLLESKGQSRGTYYLGGEPVRSLSQEAAAAYKKRIDDPFENPGKFKQHDLVAELSTRS